MPKGEVYSILKVHIDIIRKLFPHVETLHLSTLMFSYFLGSGVGEKMRTFSKPFERGTPNLIVTASG